MRISSCLCLSLFLAAGLYAQQPVVRGSVGSVVHPGGTPATTPGLTRTGGSVVNPGGGGVHLVVPHSNLNNNGRRGAPGRGGYGYAYPVYIGGGYYDSSPYVTPQTGEYVASDTQQPNTVVVYPQQAPVTPIIINMPGAGQPAAIAQTATPSVQEVAPEPEQTHYMIAFKDHTIYAAIAYWVDGQTIHYFTSGNTHNQASVSLVDREVTARLNKDSGVEVKLPDAK